jgi:hypothetical protein
MPFANGQASSHGVGMLAFRCPQIRRRRQLEIDEPHDRTGHIHDGNSR